jgi:iron complex transport system substrate-binding protein
LAGLRGRIEWVRERAGQAGTRPRTVLLEWINPLFGGGHWDPELVEIAGGVDSIGRRQEPSTQVSWEAIRDFAPEVLVVAQCGFGVARSAQDMPALEALPGYADLPAVKGDRVYVVNGSDYFSRPGPRLVDSLEMLASLLHPQLFGPSQTSPAQVVQWACLPS